MPAPLEKDAYRCALSLRQIKDTESTPPILDMEEYCYHPATRFPMGGSAELFCLLLTKEARMLDQLQGRLLGACSRFALLEAHAERIARSAPPGKADASAVLDALRALAAKGLMLSRSELMNRVASLPSSD